MTELSKTDKLREVVQRMHNNGLSFMELAKRYGADIEPEHTFDEWYFEDGKLVISWAKKINYFNTVELSLPDLLADPGAMKSLVGTACKDKYSDGNRTCSGCNGKLKTCIHKEPAHIYHSLQALKLMLTGGDAVDYLWDEMKKNKN